jgi:hypothetical protein
LLKQLSGNTTDFVDGTNTCQNLVNAVQPTIWSARLRSYNAIGNPTFEVDQRNVGTFLANPPWIQDRWLNSKTGTMAVSGGQVIPAPFPFAPGTNFQISRNALKIQLTTQQATLGAGDFLFISQIIEGPRWRELSADVHSLSLLVYSDVANLKFAVSLRDIVPSTTKSLVKLCTVPSAGTWTMIPLANLPVWPSGNFSLAPGAAGYSLSICLAAGSSFIAVSADTWQNGNFIGAPGMDNWASKSVGSQFLVAFVQHEPGALCTTPIDCPWQQNYDDCLRYFQKTYKYSTVAGTVASGGMKSFLAPTSASAFGPVTYSKPMATTPPTVTLYNHATGAANSVQDGAVVNHASAAATGVGDAGFAYITFATATTSLQPVYAQYTADTGW